MISSRPAPRATDAELEHGVPLFLTQLSATLQLSAGGRNPAIVDTATRHAGDLLARGFTVGQVVQDYGGICQVITELVGEKQVAITVGEFQSLNACLDEAIAGAVTEYARLREHEGTERMGRLAHELRNQLNSALLSYEMLKMGNVGIASSTGAVLGRSLIGLRSLIDRELAEVRLGAGIYQRETIVVFDLIEDLEVAASMEAKARGLEFSIIGLPRDVTVEADRPILEAVVANLLQNAFKFTRPHGHITLRAHVSTDRVLIDIEDQCGGLPPGCVDELFRPFEQRAIDRKGLGLGLEICARGARVNDGVIRVVDHPGTGCVFTLDLPLGSARES